MYDDITVEELVGLFKGHLACDVDSSCILADMFEKSGDVETAARLRNSHVKIMRQHPSDPARTVRLLEYEDELLISPNLRPSDTNFEFFNTCVVELVPPDSEDMESFRFYDPRSDVPVVKVLYNEQGLLGVLVSAETIGDFVNHPQGMHPSGDRLFQLPR